MFHMIPELMMDDWEPYEDDEQSESDGNGRKQRAVAFVSTRQTVSLQVDEVLDDRTPQGMVCMGTFFRQRLIARSIVPPEAWAQLESHQVFSSPVRLGLAAVEEDPGLQCRLFALLPASRLQEQTDDEPAEPWAASVPRFEDLQQQDEEPDEDAVVPLLLGHVVRFSRDRRHPDNLAAEAADVLRAILSEDRPLTNLVDKILEDL